MFRDIDNHTFRKSFSKKKLPEKYLIKGYWYNIILQGQCRYVSATEK